jgi:hypothetical protein|tara:strand:- start:54298 stop:54414 length:117 start_codon:yes stop_codon:yes gene_type:complete
MSQKAPAAAARREGNLAAQSLLQLNFSAKLRDLSQFYE